MNITTKFQICVVVSMLLAVSLIFCGFSSDKSGESKCTIIENVSDATGSINGHGYVDLGLPSGLKWATCNVGVSFPEEYGNYYAWGELKTKPEYTRNNCETSDKIGQWLYDNRYVKADGTLTLAHDVAHQNWGGTWRMPTEEEIKELIDNTKMEWVSLNGVKGLLLVSKKNNNSIFLPAGGRYHRSKVESSGGIGGFWCSNGLLNTSDISIVSLYGEGGLHTRALSRYDGYSVRPVSD